MLYGTCEFCYEKQKIFHYVVMLLLLKYNRYTKINRINRIEQHNLESYHTQE